MGYAMSVIEEALFINENEKGGWLFLWVYNVKKNFVAKPEHEVAKLELLGSEKNIKWYEFLSFFYFNRKFFN